MKTTFELNDDLMGAVREQARQRGITMRAVIEDALRRMLNAPAKQPYRLDLPATSGHRPPAVDVNSNAEIDSYLDGRDARGRRP